MDKKFFRIYHSEVERDLYLGKLTVCIADRPGSLAELAGVFSKYGININFFHYNRSEHPNRVLVEITGNSGDALMRANQEIIERNISDISLFSPHLELGLLDTGNILNIEVRLENKPGTLGVFAELLKGHDANVIYMAYNEDISETSARFSIVTRDSSEIDLLLKDMNARGYHYNLIYKGAAQKEVEDIIGLNLVERFFFKMKKMLNTEDIERLKKLAESSRQISENLINFNREAGRDLEAGNVFTGVLAFASASLSRTGDNFSFERLPSINFGDVNFHAFRLPTGGNIHILDCGDESVMIDGGYGVYFEDVKKMLRQNGIEPSRIRRIYLTHADADHAGMSGYFAREFGSSVYLHKSCRGIVEHSNRAWGSNAPYLNLNNYFTVLTNEFTKSEIPGQWNQYGSREIGRVGGFSVIDTFEISDQKYQVLESLGGHVPGQVFFLCHKSGLVFTGDYLLSTESLSHEEKEILSYPKFMMTSTNVDSQLFRKEMEMLKSLVADFDRELRNSGLRAVVVPGHGNYYPGSAFANKNP